MFLILERSILAFLKLKFKFGLFIIDV